MTIAAIGMLLGGLLFLVTAGLLFKKSRQARRRVPRIRVPGVIVRHVGMSSPPRFEFEYPGPDGSRLRSTGALAVSVSGMLQELQLLHRGSAVPVYVDPGNPSDAMLTPPESEGNGWAFAATVFLVFGISVVGFGLLFLLLAQVG